MIFGLGTDIIRIDRIAAAVARHGDRFAQRILGPQEMEKYLRRKAKVETRGFRFLATRFAAKEAFSKAIGLSADFSQFGMGTRSQRYSMLVKDGVVKQLNVEAGGKFEVSNAETMLAQL